ncbi:MAG: asparagine--tRNA ligase [Elusimicrobia bacterium]|nr:asparagine--tRNA ligase [Elusimicrobiota bacterium]
MSFPKRALIKELLASQPGTAVTLAGWVKTVRVSKGGFSFVTVNDGTCQASIQVVADKVLPNYEGEVSRLLAGASVLVRGDLVASQGKGQTVEVKASEVTVLGKADETFPIQPKKHTMEFLREVAHLRPRTNLFGAVARVRNEVCRAIHEFFQGESFLYVNTPIITASDCEGAGQMFRVSTLDPAQPPRTPEGTVDYAQDFFSKQAFLTVSGQLEGETYACALGRIYTFGPTFRAENSNTPRHLAEFWMVEPEAAFADLDDDADLAERFLKHIFRSVLARCPEDLKFLAERNDPTLVDTLKAIVDSDFARLSYTEAVELLKASGKAFEFPVSWGMDLQTEHERWLTEEKFKKPVIVMNYPAKIKAFYMRLNDDAAQHGGEPTVAAMDVLMPKIGEIIGGSQREDRLELLESRLKAQGLEPEDYWWYLDLRRYGSVPHAGFGLGLERAVQFVTGMSNIRDVIPYPRVPRSAEF